MNLLWAGVRHLQTTPLALVLKISGCNKQCKRLMTTENNIDWPWLKHWTYKLTRVQVQFWTCLGACALTFRVCQTEITGSSCSSLKPCLALAVVEELVMVSPNYIPGAAPLALGCHSQNCSGRTWEEPTPPTQTILKKEGKWEPEIKYFGMEQTAILLILPLAINMWLHFIIFKTMNYHKCNFKKFYVGFAEQYNLLF